MLGTTETVLMYYLGLEFVILLGWAVVVLDRQLDAPTARRYLRWTTISAIVGILHPAVALAARDVVGKVGVELPDNDDDLHVRHARAATLTNALALSSAIPVVVLLAVSFG